MNFLAHLFLSCDDEALLVGNFIGDFVTNRQVPGFPAGVQQGITLHRSIDSYTDRHPVVLQGVRRLYTAHRKYAPVVIDVFYDHLLAVNWALYSPENLPDFAAGVYDTLERNAHLMPPFVQKRLPLMIADDWLLNYATLDGLSFTFDRMKGRASKPELLDNAIDSLQRDFDALNEEFNDFFPDVQEYVRMECC